MERILTGFDMFPITDTLWKIPMTSAETKATYKEIKAYEKAEAIKGALKHFGMIESPLGD